MDTANWLKRIADDNCPLCGEKTTKGESTVMDSPVMYQSCTNCGFFFPDYFTHFAEKPDFLFDSEWDFQAIVDQHLRNLEAQVIAGQEAEIKLHRMKFLG